MADAPTKSEANGPTRKDTRAAVGAPQMAPKLLSTFQDILAHRAEFDDASTFQGPALEAAASSFLAFIATRPSGATLVRVLNPEESTHGWRSNKTIVEIAIEDMPFLVDSVLGEINDMELTIDGILHPVLFVKRNKDGVVEDILSSAKAAKIKAGSIGVPASHAPESVMHIEIERQDDKEVLMWVRQRIEQVLADVRVVTSDWRDMRARLTEVAADILEHPSRVAPSAELEETAEFLKWLAHDHFAFLGARDYEFVGGFEDGELRAVSGSGLGLLRDLSTHVVRRGSGPLAMSPMLRAFLQSPQLTIVTKANSRSRVHRRVYMDYIGIKTHNKKGAVIGERRFVGLFTASAYNRNTLTIPMLKEKVERVVKRANITPDGHDKAAMFNILENFPRDELFQITENELLDTSLGILRLQKRPRTKVFLRFDPFDRFVSALVFVPRERYSTELRSRIAEILVDAFDGRPSAFYPSFGDGPLARVHFIIGRNTGPRPDVDVAELEARIAAAARNWGDGLREALSTRWGDKEGRLLTKRYGAAIPTSYREMNTPQAASIDIERMEQLPPAPDVSLLPYRELGDTDDILRVKLYNWDEPVPLSDVLPVFENMGLRVLDESPHDIHFVNTVGATAAGEDCANRHLYVHEFYARHNTGQSIDLEAIAERFEDAFRAVWRGEAEDDGFNRLVIEQGLAWHEVLILRIIAKYWRQTGSALSQQLMERTFSQHGDIARMLIELFEVRLSPQAAETTEQRHEAEEALSNKITTSLDEVDSLDADRIIRRFRNVLRSIMRTNFYQRDRNGRRKPNVAIKLNSQRVQELPEPKPWAEVFLYSPRVEGVHLRFGKVARGGLRWSDRAEDFRTEVLGLVKAQKVKNSLIVPVGAKGGFVPKHLPENGSREEIQAEAIACYESFVSGLLDITDNIVAGEVVPPDHVVRHDEDDPYLVVAADKGTATFSDIANEMAASYGFWLGDAFASGGSQGYDHKKMGITARGAWDAVQRHFREMGRDIQSEPFTVVGVGDMSGDVFGNGMLLSKETQLVAAFDHRDIFIDPYPDPHSSWEERKRLYELPRSSWADYNKDLISEGGGVFSRSRKSITLTDQMRKALGIDETEISPQELMRHILRAPVDLLWFGGIGTYVKAKSESQFDVGDRSNDAIRINGRELRAKVIGEGANLGTTQRGRTEFAKNGGRINTDFIDNVSGVDTSDHEVNIKILLDGVVAEGKLSVDERNTALASMTDEVAALVLRNNYRQTLALSLAMSSARADLDSHSRFMRLLERQGKLDRAVEFLPDEEAIRELKDAGQGLARPEVAVLVSYSKNTMFEELMASDFPDDPYLTRDLLAYFPAPLSERYADFIERHQLRREIIATKAANELVNMGGLTFINRVKEHTGSSTAEIVKAFVAARDVFGLSTLRRRINDLDLKLDADQQILMQRDLANFIRRQVQWFLRYYPEGASIDELVSTYQESIAEISGRIEDLIGDFEGNFLQTRIKARVDKGADPQVARDVCALDPLSSACDIADIARAFSWPVNEAARAYTVLGDLLSLTELRADAAQLTPGDHFERLSVKRLIEDLFRQQRELTFSAIAHASQTGSDTPSGADAVDLWAQANAGPVDRTNLLVQEMESHGPLTSAKLTLAASQIRDLASAVGRRRSEVLGD